MLRQPMNQQMELEQEEERRAIEIANRQARRAGPEGFSPELDKGGLPCYYYTPGHHWEDVRFGGKRQYLDSEVIHIDPYKHPGFRDFCCKYHPKIDPAPDVEVFSHGLPSYNSIDSQAQTPGLGVMLDLASNHRDPIFGDQHFDRRVELAIGVPHVDVDLTQSPSPVLEPARGPCQASTGPIVAPANSIPTRSKIGYHVYSPNHQTDAEKRSGVPVTYVDYITKVPFEELIQLHGFTLNDVKESLFKACNENKQPCGDLLRTADDKGNLIFKGYVCNGEAFSKTSMPVIPNEETFEGLKKMIILKKGKEVGFRLLMEDPKKKARTVSRDMQFNQSVAHHHPDALDTGDHNAVEMSSIGVDKAIQHELNNLMRSYCHTNIGGRECMGFVKPDDSTSVIYLSHSLFDIWASDIVHKRHGATQLKPPSRLLFKYGPIDHAKAKLKSKSTNQSTPCSGSAVSQNTNVLSGNGPFPFNTNIPQQSFPRSDSPAPRPLPLFERYLEYCEISPEDEHTRDLLKNYNIVNFEMFFSSALNLEAMEKLGFRFGPRVRLHKNAVLY
ncbi:hypothetical protein DFH28DRAFT_1021303 [Melampsora americana]|nr:hypothetical protein DFH28DRAFT_1021303 [Melampsora americana]